MLQASEAFVSSQQQHHVQERLFSWLRPHISLFLQLLTRTMTREYRNESLGMACEAFKYESTFIVMTGRA
jgi:hypothetical protein